VKRHFYTKLPLWLVLLCIPISIFSQDIHYSNFGYSPMNINPALTGVFPGDIRGNAAYRNQWNGVPVTYSTFTGAADFRLGKPVEGRVRNWSVGGIFNYDQAGYSRLNNANVGLSGAYMLPLSKNSFLSAGINASFNQRQFRTSDLTWDDQYRNKQFNPNIISADETVFDKTHNYVTIAPGFNYHFQKPNNRLAFDAGLGIFNLNRPNVSFNDDPLHKLPVRYSFYGGANLPVSPFFDILLEGMIQLQTPHKEQVVGLGGRLYLVDKKTSRLALEAGVTLRGSDAYSPHVGLLYNQWRVGVNFDANTSPFKAATNKLGGPEISLIYIFSKVPPADCPLCPTFL
jgi:type IX secretion system PorP/SprF family membrane protein